MNRGWRRTKLLRVKLHQHRRPNSDLWATWITQPLPPASRVACAARNSREMKLSVDFAACPALSPLPMDFKANGHPCGSCSVRKGR